MVPLFDSHNHLQDSRLQLFRKSILETLPSAFISRMVVNGTSEADWVKVLELAQQSSCIVPSLGLHPWKVNEASPQWRQTLDQFLKRSPHTAIGEIGLDRWITDYDITKQLEAFHWQLDFAQRENRPVTIHCLKAWGLMLDELQKAKLPRRGFLLHSYGGPIEMLDAFTELGAYYSFSGYFAQPKNKRQQVVFQRVPADRLLVETDAPDMLPPRDLITHPLQSGGSAINSPLNLKAIYQFLAELRALPFQNLASQVAINFERFFIKN